MLIWLFKIFGNIITQNKKVHTEKLFCLRLQLENWIFLPIWGFYHVNVTVSIWCKTIRNRIKTGGKRSVTMPIDGKHSTELNRVIKRKNAPNLPSHSGSLKIEKVILKATMFFLKGKNQYFLKSERFECELKPLFN